MNNLDVVIEAIRNNEKFLLASHIQPDGDNLGSSLALYLGLKKLGKDVRVLKSDIVPEAFSFLPSIDSIEEVEEVEGNYIFIALDSADKSRLGKNINLAESAKTLINIDHHISNPMYGDINFVNSNTSSTGELVYEILNKLDLLDKNIAECLYTAISSDTGSFMYSNTSSKTHEVISNLYKYNIDAALINVYLYQNKSLKKVRLFNRAMNNMEIMLDGELVLVVVDQKILDDTGAKMEDTEGLVEHIRNIKGVELAILLKEYDGYTKVSMRSKFDIDVAKICSKFSGGGHERAAGCTIDRSALQARNLILESLEELYGWNN